MDVYGLFIGVDDQTHVWASTAVLKELGKPIRAGQLKHLRHLANVGFAAAPGSVRLKRHGVYAIQTRRSLFRIYGFFEAPDRFIAATWTQKQGQKMNRRDIARMEEAIRTREQQTWTKNLRLRK